MKELIYQFQIIVFDNRSFEMLCSVFETGYTLYKENGGLNDFGKTVIQIVRERVRVRKDGAFDDASFELLCAAFLIGYRHYQKNGGLSEFDMAVIEGVYNELKETGVPCMNKRCQNENINM